MIQRLEINRLKAGTLFHIYFVGFSMTLYPFAIIAGTAAAFGADTLKRGDVQIHGWRAILDMLVGPPIFAFFSAVFLLFCTWPGLWLFSKFKQTTIMFYSVMPNNTQQTTGTNEGALSGV